MGVESHADGLEYGGTITEVAGFVRKFLENVKPGVSPLVSKSPDGSQVYLNGFQHSCRGYMGDPLIQTFPDGTIAITKPGAYGYHDGVKYVITPSDQVFRCGYSITPGSTGPGGFMPPISRINEDDRILMNAVDKPLTEILNQILNIS